MAEGDVEMECKEAPSRLSLCLGSLQLLGASLLSSGSVATWGRCCVSFSSSLVSTNVSAASSAGVRGPSGYRSLVLVVASLMTEMAFVFSTWAQARRRGKVVVMESSTQSKACLF